MSKWVLVYTVDELPHYCDEVATLLASDHYEFVSRAAHRMRRNVAKMAASAAVELMREVGL